MRNNIIIRQGASPGSALYHPTLLVLTFCQPTFYSLQMTSVKICRQAFSQSFYVNWDQRYDWNI